MFVVIKRIRGQGESKIPLCKHRRWSLFVKVNNYLKASTVSAKKLHCRCSTGFQMRLRLEKCRKCEVQVNYKRTNFVAAYWCPGKQLRRDRTIRELGLLNNYYIDHKTFNIIAVLFLAKSNSATEVMATLIATYFLLT